MSELISKNEAAMEGNHDFKEFVQKITEVYQSEAEFIDAVKAVHLEISSLKDFLRKTLENDPTIFNIKNI